MLEPVFRGRRFTEGWLFLFVLQQQKCENIDVVARRLKVEYVFYIYIYTVHISTVVLAWLCPITYSNQDLICISYITILKYFYDILRYWDTVHSSSQNHGKVKHERPLNMYGFSLPKKTSAMFIHPFSTSKILGKKRVNKNSKTHVPSLKLTSQKDPKGKVRLPTSNHQFLGVNSLSASGRAIHLCYFRISRFNLFWWIERPWAIFRQKPQMWPGVLLDGIFSLYKMREIHTIVSLTGNRPLKIGPGPKGNFVFQPLIFRGYASFKGG